MIVNNNLRVLIFFIILLVISIAPASAMQMSGVQDISTDINEIKKNQAQLDPMLGSMCRDTEYINSRVGFTRDNWWKFWKWKEIWGIFTVEVPGKAQNLKYSADQMKPYVENIEQNAANIKTTATKTADDTNDSQPQTITNNMTARLTDKLGINLMAITILDSNALKEGDVIQYYSQNEYERYLSIHKIDVNDDFVVLKGVNGTLITVSKSDFKKNAQLQITTSLNTNSTLQPQDIVDSAYSIQKSDIDNKKTDNNKLFKTVQDLKISGMVLAGVAGLLAFIDFIILIATTVANILTAGGMTVLYGPGLAATISIMGICALLDTASGSCFIASAALESIAKNVDNEINADETDLKIYSTNIRGTLPVAHDMNLTTGYNKVLKGTFNASDADNDGLNPILNSTPQNGSITIKGMNFEYTPNQNFIVNDTITYQVIDVHGDKSQIATIHITVLENQAPIAYNMTIETNKDQNITCTLNATDPDGDKLIPIIDQKPTNSLKVIL